MDTRKRLTMEEALEMFPSIGDALCVGCEIKLANNIIIFGASCHEPNEDKGEKSNFKIYPGKKKEEGSCHYV